MATAPPPHPPTPSVPPAGADDRPAPSLGRWFWPWLIGILVLDLISKHLVFGAVAHPDPDNEQRVLEDLYVRWHAWEWVLPSFNKGVAWSMFNQFPGLVAITTLVLIPVLALVFFRWFRRGSPLEVLAFGAVLGGAIGNGWDRILALMVERTAVHGVRDFIHVDLGFWPLDPWPTFNIADAGITIGFLALLLSMGGDRAGRSPVRLPAPVKTPTDASKGDPAPD